MSKVQGVLFHNTKDGKKRLFLYNRQETFRKSSAPSAPTLGESP